MCRNATNVPAGSQNLKCKHLFDFRRGFLLLKIKFKGRKSVRKRNQIRTRPADSDYTHTRICT